MIECTKEDCDQKHLARGYCKKHYDQAKRLGEINSGIPCKVEVCKKSAYSKGYCHFHWDRNRRGKSFDDAYYKGKNYEKNNN